MSLPERPHKIGLPSIFDDSWDPVMRACADTDTVICQHVGSSGLADVAPGAPSGTTATLFGQLALTSCAEWVWSGWPLRYPDLKIAMSEGGLGWVAMLLDRLDFMADRGEYLSNGYGPDVRPGDVVQRNFWFCTIDDRSTIDTRRRIGVENVMLEVDFPHGDTTWPDTQRIIEDHWGHIPDDELRLMTHANAAKLFRHPLPESDPTLMTSTVRAAIYVPGADDLVVETVTPLPPAPRDVVVRVDASGVCHSDQAVIDGKRLGPIMLGHEATGVVQWSGPEVTRVQPGDRVIMSLTPVCGRCWYCAPQRDASLRPQCRDAPAPPGDPRRRHTGQRTCGHRKLRRRDHGRRGVVHPGADRPPR